MGDIGGELTPTTAKIFEASAAALAPKTIDNAGYTDLCSQAIPALHKQQTTHDEVDEYILKVLPKHTKTDRAVFSLHISAPTKAFGHTVMQEYIMPVTPPQDKSVPKTGKNMHAVDAPALVIPDFPKFIAKMNDFFETGITHYHIRRWAPPSNPHRMLDTLWYHATPHDLQHPEQYIDRMIHHIQERTFYNLEYSPSMVPLPSGNYTLEIKNDIAAPDMEAPNDLNIKLIPENDLKWETIGSLPTVRYGTDGNKAYIYAVQSKTTTTEDILEENQLIHQDAVDLHEYFLDMYTRFPEDYEKILGKIPEPMVHLKDAEQFVTQYFEHLHTTYPKLFIQENTSDWIHQKDPKKFTSWEELENSIHHRLVYEIDRLAATNGDIKNMPHRMELPQKRKELMRKLFQLDNGLPDDPEYKAWKRSVDDQKQGIPTTIPEYPEGNITDVPRPAVVSLTAACELFREAGMQELVIPTYFPLRWQDHLMTRGTQESERIQNATTNTFVRLFRRIEAQVDGLEITQLPDEDGFMKIRFTHPDKPLTSTNPLLQDVLTGISEKKIKLRNDKEIE